MSLWQRLYRTRMTATVPTYLRVRVYVSIETKERKKTMTFTKPTSFSSFQLLICTCHSTTFVVGTTECPKGHQELVVVCAVCKNRCRSCCVDCATPLFSSAISNNDGGVSKDVGDNQESKKRKTEIEQTVGKEPGVLKDEKRLHCAICDKTLNANDLRKHWTTVKHCKRAHASDLKDKYCGLNCERRHRKPWISMKTQEERMKVNAEPFTNRTRICEVCGGYVQCNFNPDE